MNEPIYIHVLKPGLAQAIQKVEVKIKSYVRNVC